MPLAPACWKNVSAHFRVEKNNFRVRPPRPAEPDIFGAGRGGQSAVVEYKSAVLGGIVLGLCGEEAFRVRGAVNFTVIEDGLAVAENEIDIALDVAVGKVLAGCDACLTV